jgi:hypothetical protein
MIYDKFILQNPEEDQDEDYTTNDPANPDEYDVYEDEDEDEDEEKEE